MPSGFRTVEEKDLQAVHDLTMHIWHDYYGAFLPRAFLDVRYAPDACLQRQKEAIRLCLEKPDTHHMLLSFDHDDNMTGMAYISKCDPLSDNGPFDLKGFDTELHRLYLYPQIRSRGLGTDFLQRIAPWVKKNDLQSCFAWSFEDNPAKEFYLKKGASTAMTIEYNYAGTILPVTAFGWTNFPKTFGATK